MPELCSINIVRDCPGCMVCQPAFVNRNDLQFLVAAAQEALVELAGHSTWLNEETIAHLQEALGKQSFFQYVLSPDVRVKL